MSGITGKIAAGMGVAAAGVVAGVAAVGAGTVIVGGAIGVGVTALVVRAGGIGEAVEAVGVAVSRLAGGILGTNDGYTGLEKKDDDFGIVESEGWLVMHPANKVGELDVFNTAEIEAYGNEVIKNLCKVPITSSTKPSIEARLIEMSEQSNILRKLLIRRLDELQGDKEAILEMKGNIIMTRG